MLLTEALMKLAEGKTLEGRLGNGKWFEYRVSDDGTEILLHGDPVRLDDFIDLEWRDATKTSDVWVKEAKALLEMGAQKVDAGTLSGVLAKVSELEAQANEAFERGKKEATNRCRGYIWNLAHKHRTGQFPDMSLEGVLLSLMADLKDERHYWVPGKE